MADTPLHEHEAVKHLLASEFCPTREGVDDVTHPLMYRDGPGWTWGYSMSKPNIQDVIDAITIAAVRAMWAQKNMVFAHKSKQGGYLCSVVPMEEDAFGTNGPTEPLDILAAYQATVMGKESSK